MFNTLTIITMKTSDLLLVAALAAQQPDEFPVYTRAATPRAITENDASVAREQVRSRAAQVIRRVQPRKIFQG